MDELDELRLRIAQMRGYMIFFEIAAYVVTRDSGMVTKGSPQVPCITSNFPVRWQCPRWPREIAAAWMLVEEIRDTGAYMEIVNGYGDPCDYRATIKNGEGQLVEWREGATAPEAISRAWLAWKGAE